MLPLAAGELFPEFRELKPETVYPKNAALTVSKEGHFLVNGVPRYLPGTLFYEGSAPTVKNKTGNYPASLDWIYENVQDYEGHQRLGFDATGIAVGNGWLAKYRPRMRRNFADTGDEQLQRAITSGLPLYIDYTCSPWHHGQLQYQPGLPPSRDAFSAPAVSGHHWLPYNLNSPEGRQLYADMWKYGVEFTLARGGKPFVYELVNEPAYN